MIRCPQCGTDNLDGSEYCDECGYQLHAVLSAPPVAPPPSAAPVGPRPSGSLPPREAASYGVAPAVSGPAPVGGQGPTPGRQPAGGPYADFLPPPPNVPSVPMIPAPRPAAAPLEDVFAVAPPAPQLSAPAPPPQPTLPPPSTSPTNVADRSPQTNTPSSPKPSPTGVPRAKLVIQRGGTVGKEFILTETESNIGRWDADGGIFPDVDLDQDDPEAKVSRRHARIVCQDGQYVLEDLGSTNGTFVNRGRRLLPGNRHPLNDGDEIIVGKTFLKFHYIR